MQAACENARLSALLRRRSTADIIKQTKEILSLDAGEYSDDANSERLEDFKTATKAYVADYRRLVSPAQKSFSETYGVITGAGSKCWPMRIGLCAACARLSACWCSRLPRIQHAAMLARAHARCSTFVSTCTSSCCIHTSNRTVVRGRAVMQLSSGTSPRSALASGRCRRS